jgi:hypothetical protein
VFDLHSRVRHLFQPKHVTHRHPPKARKPNSLLPHTLSRSSTCAIRYASARIVCVPRPHSSTFSSFRPVSRVSRPIRRLRSTATIDTFDSSDSVSSALLSFPSSSLLHLLRSLNSHISLSLSLSSPPPHSTTETKGKAQHSGNFSDEPLARRQVARDRRLGRGRSTLHQFAALRRSSGRRDHIRPRSDQVRNVGSSGRSRRLRLGLLRESPSHSFVRPKR